MRARLPFTIKYGLPLALLVAAGWWLRDTWSESRGVLRLVDAAGEPVAVDGATLQLFPFDDDPASPSPLPPLGEPIPVVGDSVQWPSDQLGEGLLVRFEAPGQGRSFADVAPGKITPLVIGPPRRVTGMLVTEAHGEPVAGAPIEVLGGGARGVPLAVATSGADGSFVVDTIGSGVEAWCVRVMATGFAAVNHLWYPALEKPLHIELARTAPVRGSVRVATGLDFDPAGAALRVFHLPGVNSEVAADGSFEIDHLPPTPKSAHLLLELPAGLTHRRATVFAGQRDFELDVVASVPVSGRVVNGHTQFGVAGAQVFHDHGPGGVAKTLTAADGSFVIDRVPPGRLELNAFIRVPWGSLPEDQRAGESDTMSYLKRVTGTVALVVLPGQPVADVEIVIW